MSEMYEPLCFDSIELIEIPVKLGSRWFILEEASGLAVAIYRDAQFATAEFSSEGKPLKMGKLAQQELLIVRECLYQAMPEEGHTEQKPKLKKALLDGRPVKADQEFVDSLPNKVTKRLYDKVKVISELNVEEKPEAGKSQPGGEQNGTPSGLQSPNASENRSAGASNMSAIAST